MGRKRAMYLIQESLSDDEGIINYIYCHCKTIGGLLKEPKSGVFAVTNKRVIFAHSGFLGLTKILEDVDLESIDSVKTQTGWWKNEILIEGKTKSTMHLTKIRKKRMVDIRRDIDDVRNKD